MQKILFAALVAVVAFPLAAQAECTTDQAMKKAQDLTAAVQAAMQANPQKAQELSAKMTATMQKFQGAASSDEVCAAYDELLAEAKQ